jgi:formate hydrogenlyase subunit 4
LAWLLGEVKMSNSLKEVIIKCFFVFLILYIVGIFIKWLALTLLKALAIALVIALLDGVYVTLKNSNKKIR